MEGGNESLTVCRKTYAGPGVLSKFTFESRDAGNEAISLRSISVCVNVWVTEKDRLISGRGVGLAEGLKVGRPAPGEGRAEGRTEGTGVGTPGVNVGKAVGEAEGPKSCETPSPVTVTVPRHVSACPRGLAVQPCLIVYRWHTA